MISLRPLEHQFSGCKCGHAEHIATRFSRSEGKGERLDSPPRICCEPCDEIERNEEVLLSVIPIRDAAMMAISTGTIVKIGNDHHQVVAADEIRKLNGGYRTGYVRVKLRKR